MGDRALLGDRSPIGVLIRGGRRSGGDADRGDEPVVFAEAVEDVMLNVAFLLTVPCAVQWRRALVVGLSRWTQRCSIARRFWC